MSSESTIQVNWNDLEQAVRKGQAARLLIVDDEESIRMLMKSLLENDGYQMEFCAAGEEAQAKLRQNEYDLLIVDKNLPDLSGLDLLREAQQLQPHLASIVITGYRSYDSLVEAMRLSAYDYIEKPFKDVDLIRQKVREVLAKSRNDLENRILADCVRETYLARRREQLAAQESSASGRQDQDLQVAVSAVVEPLQEARARLREAVEQAGGGNPQIAELDDHLEKAWLLLWKVVTGEGR